MRWLNGRLAIGPRRTAQPIECGPGYGAERRVASCAAEILLSFGSRAAVRHDVTIGVGVFQIAITTDALGSCDAALILDPEFDSASCGLAVRLAEEGAIRQHLVNIRLICHILAK